jgi:hypothetical protein
MAKVAVKRGWREEDGTLHVHCCNASNLLKLSHSPGATTAPPKAARRAMMVECRQGSRVALARSKERSVHNNNAAEKESKSTITQVCLATALPDSGWKTTNAVNPPNAYQRQRTSAVLRALRSSLNASQSTSWKNCCCWSTSSWRPRRHRTSLHRSCTVQEWLLVSAHVTRRYMCCMCDNMQQGARSTSACRDYTLRIRIRAGLLMVGG